MIRSFFAIVMLAIIGCVEIGTDGSQQSDEANNGDGTLVIAPASTPTPASKEDFVKCNRDYIEKAPEFLELFHRYMDRMCKELEKAKIAMECPGAKEEAEKYIEAVYWDFALSLSESEQLRFVTQINSAQEFLPDRPDICSPEWINENIGPLPTPTPWPTATPTLTVFEHYCSIIVDVSLIRKFERLGPEEYVLPVGYGGNDTLDLSEYYRDWSRVDGGMTCSDVIRVLSNIESEYGSTSWDNWEDGRCFSNDSLRCSVLERMIVYFSKYFGVPGKDRRQ